MEFDSINKIRNARPVDQVVAERSQEIDRKYAETEDDRQRRERARAMLAGEGAKDENDLRTTYSHGIADNYNSQARTMARSLAMRRMGRSGQVRQGAEDLARQRDLELSRANSRAVDEAAQSRLALRTQGEGVLNQLKEQERYNANAAQWEKDLAL